MAVESTEPGDVAGGQPRWHGLLRALTEDAPDAPLGEGLRRAAHGAAELIGCRYAVLAVLDSKGGLEHFIPAAADQRDVNRAGRMRVRDGALAPVLDAARTVREPAVLGIPVVVDGDTVGGLYLCDRTDGAPFTEADEEQGQLIAGVVAAIVRRARLAQASVQRQRWLSESAELTRDLLSGEHPDSLPLVVERVRDMAAADLVAVVKEGVDGQSYEVIEAAGPRAAAVQGRVISAGGTLTAEVISQGVPRLVSDLARSNRRSSLGELAGADSAIFAPLSGAGIGRGMLAMFRRPERPAFTVADADVAVMFVAQMTLALELADTRAKRERGALLDERGRIARDLHDHVIQRLFAIGLTTQSVTAQVDQRAADRLQDCVAGIDEAITQIRSTIYRLTGPLVSAENSIRTRAARLVEDMAPVLGFRAELDVRGPIDFGVEDDLTDDCVAVLREALTNAAKHAQANRVSVTITVSAAELCLEVTDDGRGIGGVSRRSGLANLRTRAERRRGRLIVASGAPRGTRLTWTVPIGTASRSVRSVG